MNDHRPAAPGDDTVTSGEDPLTAGEATAASGGATAASGDDTAALAPLVDWSRLGRRIGLSAIILLGASVVAWVVVGLVSGGPRIADLFDWLGLGFGLMFVAEVVFVGGSALRGMLRAGERGDRLAGGDVGLLPPQLTRSLTRSRTRGPDGAGSGTVRDDHGTDA